PGERLFRYRERGGWRDLDARELNQYLRELTGMRFNAKDFRTWGGTVRMATVLAELGAGRSAREAHKNVVMALRLVAAELGNTPAICRSSYVHPIVIARYESDGETIALARHARHARRARRRALRGYYPEERALLAFLDKYFPERRRRLRAEELAARGRET
ncbi:MAG: DNA topoisomerase IB, partial [Gemmatimonadaceae bacterium]